MTRWSLLVIDNRNYIFNIMHISREFLENLALIFILGTISYKISRKIAPYIFTPRRGESILAHIQKVSVENRKKALKQQNLNTTYKKSLLIRITNFSILAAYLVVNCYLIKKSIHYVEFFSFTYFGYVFFGFVIIRLLRVVPKESLEGLNWNSRTEIYLIYIWSWPFHVFQRVKLRE